MGGFTRHMTKRESEIRTENRYTWHPQGKKRCTRCETVYENIRDNFDIHHKRKDGTYGYSGPCKICLRDSRVDRLDRYKQDIGLYVKKLLPSLRCRAKKQKLKFDLALEDLVELWINQSGNCYYTNEPMNLQAKTEGRKAPHINFPSVDRLVPSNGYVKNNVAWCRYGVNRMKNMLSEQEFISFCKKVLENRN